MSRHYLEQRERNPVKPVTIITVEKAGAGSGIPWLDFLAGLR